MDRLFLNFDQIAAIAKLSNADPDQSVYVEASSDVALQVSFAGHGLALELSDGADNSIPATWTFTERTWWVLEDGKVCRLVEDVVEVAHAKQAGTVLLHGNLAEVDTDALRPAAR